MARKAIDWDTQIRATTTSAGSASTAGSHRTSSGADPAEVQKPESEWPGILKHVHEAHLKSVQDFAAQPAPAR
jgi:hypothetical protein